VVELKKLRGKILLKKGSGISKKAFRDRTDRRGQNGVSQEHGSREGPICMLREGSESMKSIMRSRKEELLHHRERLDSGGKKTSRRELPSMAGMESLWFRRSL